MTRIFVGNLPHSATESEVRFLFERHGRVSSVQIKTEQGSNKPRGFAFVTMPSMEDAEDAIAHLSHTVMGGRSLTINEAQARPEGAQHDGAGSTNSNRQTALAMFGALQSDE